MCLTHWLGDKVTYWAVLVSQKEETRRCREKLGPILKKGSNSAGLATARKVLEQRTAAHRFRTHLESEKIIITIMLICSDHYHNDHVTTTSFFTFSVGTLVRSSLNSSSLPTMPKSSSCKDSSQNTPFDNISTPVPTGTADQFADSIGGDLPT